MHRRSFLKSALVPAAAAPLLPRSFGQTAAAAPFADLDVRIDKIVCFRAPYARPRIVGGNAGYKLAGGTRHDWMIALYGNNGKIGLGSSPRYGRPNPSRFPVGKTIRELMGTHLTQTAAEIGTTALWDLAGKTLGKPVYELLGGKARPEGVPVYDGGIYMEELVNRDANSPHRNPNAPYGKNPSWKDIFKEAIDVSKAHGHNFVKVKIGRGHLHLDRQAGNIQDVAVLRFIRDYAGPGFKIGVDANNGYDLADTLWLINEHGDLNLEFIEEMFPEDLSRYREVKHAIKAKGLKTLIADGENWITPHDPGVPELIHSGVIDVLQGDMRMFQIEGMLAEAELARQAGPHVQIAPHNWGCEYAWYVMIHLGNVLPHYYGAEHDIGTPTVEIMVKDGYQIRNGHCHAPAAPGFGVTLNESLLSQVETVFEFS